MTQQDLADTADVDLKTVYNLESGGRWPIARTRIAISRALGWSGDGLADLATGTVAVRSEGSDPPPEPPAREAEQLARAMGIDPDDPNDPFLRPVRQEIADATMEYGAAATGTQVFHGRPGSAIEANLWDNPNLGRKAKELAIAILRVDRARQEAGRRGDSRTTAGLTHRLTLAGR